ncbi:cytochrome P450 [Cryphonectria parasitica EP155]|uniref:Cytochrome P450 n=1 Tax=Cryphonectria parasitica (strain ATCC 38755 / EP155) TaxID=660469 RepID=A0A9P4XVR1_CRYP1|nr:cytochrome P450 [Cryphonectria parasitica EP155]KAF3761798.1 cytochrome P450 [Cryphonectria parasitica EP155]
MDFLSDRPWAQFSLLFGPLLFLIYHFFIHPALISPLSRIPNAHWSAPVTPLWILYKRFKRQENGTLEEAHKRLGPFVRVAPNEVSVDDLDGVRTIYQGGFEKTQWYSVFDNYGVPCMFSSRTSKDHSLRKRMISNVYSKSYIQASPAAAAQAEIIIHDRLLPTLEKSLADQGVDVYSLFLAVVMDFISAYIWGISRSTNFVQNKGYREHWLELYKSRNDYGFFPQELPRLTAFCKRFGVSLYPGWVDAANKELAAWNTLLCEQTSDHLTAASRASKDEASADDAVVMRALINGIDKEEAANGEKSLLYHTSILQRDLSIQSELWDHVLAGQETAGLTLTYLTWRMCQRPELQAQLREELLTVQPTARVEQGRDRSLPDPKKLDSLPLLHAIVMETMRLHAPIPGPQPREVPYPSAKLGPYTIPGGVRIAAAAHTLHRDEGVFARPEEWDPTRWLNETDQDSRRAMNRQFWAFSSGGRMCIGSNFAVHEMKLITAMVYLNYTTFIVDDAGIEQGDGYTGRPASEQLWLRFERVSSPPACPL